MRPVCVAVWHVGEGCLMVPGVCVVGVSCVHMCLWHSSLPSQSLRRLSSPPPPPHQSAVPRAPGVMQGEGDTQSHPVPVLFTLSRFSSDRFLRPLSATNTS